MRGNLNGGVLGIVICHKQKNIKTRLQPPPPPPPSTAVPLSTVPTLSPPTSKLTSKPTSTPNKPHKTSPTTMQLAQCKLTRPTMPAASRLKRRQHRAPIRTKAQRISSSAKRITKRTLRLGRRGNLHRAQRRFTVVAIDAIGLSAMVAVSLKSGVARHRTASRTFVDLAEVESQGVILAVFLA